MIRNRFEEVDEVQPDAITLSLSKDETGASGMVICPALVTGGRLQQDAISDKLPSIDAFRSAVRLANEIKAPIVVMDPDHVWHPEWGQLYQAE